jgi:parallel beta-helix repeat protein
MDTSVAICRNGGGCWFVGLPQKTKLKKGLLMVESHNRSRHKWFVPALVLLLIFILSGALFWFNAVTNQNNGSSNHWYEYNTTATIHISSNGDIKVPTTFNSSNTIQQIGNTYILTGNLEGDLIIEKSNIIFDGKGYNVGAVSAVNIKLSNVNNVTLQNVAIKATYGSLLLSYSSYNKISNVSGIGFRLSFSNHNEIFNSSSSSIKFQDSSNNKVNNSNIGGLGFDLENSNYNLILNNNCTGQGRSIYLSDSSHNLIFGNTLKAWWWISMSGDSSYNTFVANNITISQHYLTDRLKGTNYIYHNNFVVFSWDQASTANSVNVWSNDGKGNYWVDWSGPDANHDGIVDSPYIIDVNNIDNYPLTTPVNISAEPLPPLN